MTRRTLLGIFLTLIFIISATFTAAVFVADKILSNMSDMRVEKYEHTPGEYGLNAEEFTSVTADGLHINACLFRKQDAKGTVLILHGMHGQDATSLFPYAKFISDAGFNAVAVNMRGHGKSEGQIAFAYKEPLDIQAVISELKEHMGLGDSDFILYGLSMGGSSAINAGALIGDLKGIIAISPFASMGRQVTDYIKKMDMPAFVNWVMKQAFFTALRIKYGSGSPEENIRRLDGIPVLLMHGTADSQTAYYHSELLAELGSDKCRLVAFEGADHLILAETVLSDSAAEYRKNITGFLKEIIDFK